MRETGIHVVSLGCVLLGVLAGCAGEQAPGIIIEADSAGIRIVTSDRPLGEWTLAAEPELDLGTVETGGPTEFFLVEAARFLPRDRFVVANRGTEELRFFDRAGGFLGSAGRAGRGPEEFTGLNWVRVFGDSVLTHDWGNDRVSVRDLSGGFGRAFRLEWRSGILLPLDLLQDGTVLGLSLRHMTELEEAGTQLDVGFLSRHDLDGAMVGSVGNFPVGERVVHREGNRQTTIGLPLSENASFSAWQQGFCYVFGAEFQVECFDVQGTPTTIMRVLSPPRAVRLEEVDDAFEYELNRAREGRNQPREQALLRARPSMRFPEKLPAFSDLLTDDRDQIWVRKYELPGTEVVEWWIFGEGRWVGRLKSDPAFRILDISGDRVLGVWRDELGIERIRVYRFEPSHGG